MSPSIKEIEYDFPSRDQEHFTIAVDIGGSLAKVVYSPRGSGKLRFKTVETEKIDKFVQLLHRIIAKHNGGSYTDTRIVATGGGAFKFQQLLDSEFSQLGQPIVQFDEMACLIKGLDFFIHEIDNEIFTYNDSEGFDTVPKNNDSSVYPYMLVNIGSGVSILKVSQPNDFVRVGGSSLGGGTLWGLLSLITGAKTYDQMLEWAQAGDNTNVDMLVGDIYGTDYNKIGLKSSSIASSFGKVFQDRRKIDKKKPYVEEALNGTSISESDSEDSLDQAQEMRRKSTDVTHDFNNEDICKSLLYAVSNNIGQIAYLQANIHNVQNIYFGGSYIRGHLTTMNTLSYAINFWSQGSKKAFFLKHEGYLGAMGALLHTTSEKQLI